MVRSVDWGSLSAMVSGGAWTGGRSVPHQGWLYWWTPCSSHCWQPGVPCQCTSRAPARRTSGSGRHQHHGRRAAAPPPPALCCAAKHNRLGLGVRDRVRGREIVDVLYFTQWNSQRTTYGKVATPPGVYSDYFSRSLVKYCSLGKSFSPGVLIGTPAPNGTRTGYAEPRLAPTLVCPLLG